MFPPQDSRTSSVSARESVGASPPDIKRKSIWQRNQVPALTESRLRDNESPEVLQKPGTKFTRTPSGKISFEGALTTSELEGYRDVPPKSQREHTLQPGASATNLLEANMKAMGQRRQSQKQLKELLEEVNLGRGSVHMQNLTKAIPEVDEFQSPDLSRVMDDKPIPTNKVLTLDS